MTTKLYTRVRGQVRGPFDQGKLRQLVKRGQLTRIHEVSEDGTTWQKASEFGELFEAEAPSVESPTTAQQSADAQAYNLQPQNQPAATQTAPQEWYYTQGNQQYGPIDLRTLRKLVKEGSVSSDDEIWSHGMDDWVAVSDHSQLNAVLQQTTVQQAKTTQVEVKTADSSTKSNSEIGGQLVRTLAESSGWLTFIVIIGYIYGALLLVGALIMMLAGASERIFPVVGIGIVWLVYAGVTITGAVLLNRHINAIADFVRAKNQQTLDLALRRIRTFWVFVSIVLTVILVNTIGIVIWVCLSLAQIASAFR